MGMLKYQMELHRSLWKKSHFPHWFNFRIDNLLWKSCKSKQTWKWIWIWQSKTTKESSKNYPEESRLKPKDPFTAKSLLQGLQFCFLLITYIHTFSHNKWHSETESSKWGRNDRLLSCFKQLSISLVMALRQDSKNTTKSMALMLPRVLNCFSTLSNTFMKSQPSHSIKWLLLLSLG